MVVSAPDILKTKLTPPSVRADRVHRPRLTQQFSDSLEHLLTLICAPAGYGKTTLLGEWLASEAGRSVPVAWFSLEEDDNDPTRFLTYLVSALTNVSSMDGNDVLSLLQTPHHPPVKAVLTTMISRLEDLPHHVVLVLDDYHLITALPIHEAMTFLLDHLPAGMRLIITSREDPPFPLARLRGRGQLTEIRADDLRFTSDEAGQFLEKMLGIRLSGDQIKDLDARTEGWIVGLQLAALAMKGRDDVAAFITTFTGSHRFILDYLTEEVLSRQTEKLQSFLLQTSILNRLSGPLCDEVTGRGDGQILLEQIEHGNLFLNALDGERFWYSYHPLFQDMLFKRLRQSTHNADIHDLHRRASRWFAGENLFNESISHAIAAADFEFAAHLMEESSRKYVIGIWGNFAIRQSNQIPDEVMCSHPLLLLNIGLWHSLMGRSSLALKQVRLVRTSMEASPADSQELLGYADTIEALVLGRSNEPERAVIAADSALARLTENQYDLRARAFIVKGIALQQQFMFEQARVLFKQAVEIGRVNHDFVVIASAMGQSVQSYLVEGRLQAAEAEAQTMLEMAKAANCEYLPTLGVAHVALAEIQFEQNRLAESEASAFRCLELCDPVLPDAMLSANFILTRIYHLNANRQDLQSAVLVIQKILEENSLVPARISLRFLTHLWVIQEVFALIKQFPTPMSHLQETRFEALIFKLETLRAQVGENTPASHDQSFRLVKELHELLASPAPLACVLEMLILEALLLDASGQVEHATTALTRAIELAAPHGFVRIFIDEGIRMATLLREVQARGIAVAYITKLLSTFDHGASAATSAPSEQQFSGDIEPLSERELEVLRLIAVGASNREIGQALVVSVGTVKKHLNNIFLKLDAHNRTQAVATARNHNLL